MEESQSILHFLMMIHRATKRIHGDVLQIPTFTILEGQAVQIMPTTITIVGMVNHIPQIQNFVLLLLLLQTMTVILL
jgi:hypothetical protein